MFFLLSAVCLLPPSFLPTTRKQSREGQDLSESHDRLQLLQSVSGNDNLIAGDQIDRIRRLATIDGGEVDRNLRQTSVRLLTQDHNLFAIARLQYAASLGDGFAHRKTPGHQSDSRLSYVADHAIAI